MASTINGTSTGSGGLISTGDDSGILNIQTNETTAISINASQGVEFNAGTAALPAITTTGDTNTGIFFPSADTIAFTEGGAEAMRIDSSGNVGIGTSSPSNAISVSRSTGEAVISITNAGSTSSWLVLAPSSSGNAYIHNTSNVATVFTTNGTERARIDSSGGLILVGSTAQKATGTTWSNPSDERLKDNIRDYAKGTTELMQVRVREWEYNGKGGTVDGTKGLGVVADEVMVVLPDTVENYEAKLNVDDEEVTAIKKFDATEITWLLVKTVQELKAIVDTQAETINALTARVVALEGQ